MIVMDRDASISYLCPPSTLHGQPTRSAGQALGSPVAVMGSSVLVGSADNHLYSFERLTGSQRWRYNLCQEANCTQMTLAPMIYENEIFIADQNRTIWALNDQGWPQCAVACRISSTSTHQF